MENGNDLVTGLLPPRVRGDDHREDGQAVSPAAVADGRIGPSFGRHVLLHNTVLQQLRRPHDPVVRHLFRDSVDRHGSAPHSRLPGRREIRLGLREHIRHSRHLVQRGVRRGAYHSRWRRRGDRFHGSQHWHSLLQPPLRPRAHVLEAHLRLQAVPGRGRRPDAKPARQGVPDVRVAGAEAPLGRGGQPFEPDAYGDERRPSLRSELPSRPELRSERLRAEHQRGGIYSALHRLRATAYVRATTGQLHGPTARGVLPAETVLPARGWRSSRRESIQEARQCRSEALWR